MARDVAVDVALSAALPVVGEIRAGRRVVALADDAARFLSESRHLREVNEARKDFSRIGASADDVGAAIARSSGWQTVTTGGIAGGRVSVGSGVVQYTMKALETGETVFNAWIP